MKIIVDTDGGQVVFEGEKLSFSVQDSGMLYVSDDKQKKVVGAFARWNHLQTADPKK